MTFSITSQSQNPDKLDGILMSNDTEPGVIFAAASRPRTARYLAALSITGQRDQSPRRSSELKIDFSGSAAIRSPITRCRSVRYTGRPSRVRRRVLDELSSTRAAVRRAAACAEGITLLARCQVAHHRARRRQKTECAETIRCNRFERGKTPHVWCVSRARLHFSGRSGERAIRRCAERAA